MFKQITELYTSLQNTEPMQNQITSSLDYVETQQKELSQILDSYEKSVGEMTTSINPHMGSGADAERDRS